MKKPTEERILQISNDIAEDMGNATKQEYRETIRYWMKEHTAICNRLQNAQSKHILAATQLLAQAHRMIQEKL